MWENEKGLVFICWLVLYVNVALLEANAFNISSYDVKYRYTKGCLPDIKQRQKLLRGSISRD